MAVRDDPVDVKMAEFINSYYDQKKKRLLVTRETEGIYTIENNRVGVRLVKDRLSVWTGNSYIPIEQFVETPSKPTDATKAEQTPNHAASRVVIPKSQIKPIVFTGETPSKKVQQVEAA